MEFNDTAILVLVIFCGVILIPALAMAGGLIFSLAADAGKGTTQSVVRIRGSRKWRRYEHRTITGE